MVSATQVKPDIVALEEHYWDDELAAQFGGVEARHSNIVDSRLRSFGGERIKDMDEAGITMSVLSHGAPSGQRLSADIAVPLIKRVNDRLHAAVLANPGRFAAFAALPTAVPEAAADELERCVELGFKGAMIHGPTNGEFLDHKKFWPIFERAERLDTPIYLHPSVPPPEVLKLYYADYLQDHRMFAGPGWGFTVECGTQAIRLMLSGVFEKHPNLKIILGHLGETLPFHIWRTDSALSRPGQKSAGLREIFANNFWITTSGFFSTPALICCVMEMGVDRIMFSVDWPFVADSAPGTEWIAGVPLCAADKEKIMSKNARQLLKL